MQASHRQKQQQQAKKGNGKNSISNQLDMEGLRNIELTLQNKATALCNELATIERSIQSKEDHYITHTWRYGNVIRGYDQFLENSGDGNGASTNHSHSHKDGRLGLGDRIRKSRLGDRVFSISSSTSKIRVVHPHLQHISANAKKKRKRGAAPWKKHFLPFLKKSNSISFVITVHIMCIGRLTQHKQTRHVVPFLLLLSPPPINVVDLWEEGGLSLSHSLTHSNTTTISQHNHNQYFLHNGFFRNADGQDRCGNAWTCNR